MSQFSARLVAMLERIYLHTITLLRFYARSRLLLGFALIVMVLWALGLIPFFLFDSDIDRFETLKLVSGQIRSYAWFYTAGLGLFALWSHMSHRSTSLIFTRPGPPELWLASVWLSVFTVAMIVHLIGAAVTLALSLAWGIPYQVGFIWLMLDSLLETVIVVSALTAMASFVHPVIAVLVFAVFNESTFYRLDILLLGLIEGRGGSPLLTAAEGAVRAVYTAMPMLDPFVEKTGSLDSLRVELSNWGYLAATAGYAALACTFFFIIADLGLRRRSSA